MTKMSGFSPSIFTIISVYPFISCIDIRILLPANERRTNSLWSHTGPLTHETQHTLVVEHPERRTNSLQPIFDVCNSSTTKAVTFTTLPELTPRQPHPVVRLSHEESTRSASSRALECQSLSFLTLLTTTFDNNSIPEHPVVTTGHLVQ